MSISSELTNVKAEIPVQLAKLGAKIRTQQVLLSKLAEVNNEILYTQVALDDLNKRKDTLEMERFISSHEKKITDLDCIMLKMGARLT